MKTCTKCGETKPKTEFGKHPSGGDGLRPTCKSCHNAAGVQWAKDNRERRRETAAKWRADNRDKCRAYAAKYFSANIEKERERCRKYNSENSDTRRAASKNWRTNNPDKAREAAKKWREANPDYDTEWRKANPEKTIAAVKKWKAKNPEADRVHRQNRRSRQANSGNLSKNIAVNLLKLQRGKCACCGQPLGDDYHLDHIMPLALGGTNTDNNIQLLRAECNLQKHAKHPVDYMQERGMLL